MNNVITLTILQRSQFHRRQTLIDGWIVPPHFVSHWTLALNLFGGGRDGLPGTRSFFSFMCCNSTVVNRCSMFMPLPVLLLVGTFESQSINFKGVWLKGHHGGVVTAADCVFPLWHEVRCVLFSVGMIAFKVAGHLGNEKPAGCTVSGRQPSAHIPHTNVSLWAPRQRAAKSLIANNLQSTLDFLHVNVSFVREFVCAERIVQPGPFGLSRHMEGVMNASVYPKRIRGLC